MSSQKSVPSFLLFLELFQDTFQRKSQNPTSEVREGWKISPQQIVFGFFKIFLFHIVVGALKKDKAFAKHGLIRENNSFYKHYQF